MALKKTAERRRHLIGCCVPRNIAAAAADAADADAAADAAATATAAATAAAVPIAKRRRRRCARGGGIERGGACEAHAPIGGDARRKIGAVVLAPL